MSWRGGLRRLLPYVVALVGGFGLAYLVIAFFVFPSGVLPAEVRVPNVIGLTYADAERQLEQVGLKAERGESRFHNAAPKGTVLDQQPAAGSVETPGLRVALVVSSGQRLATVPGVIGMSREQALTALESAGFVAGEIVTRPSNEPFGAVIDSRPRPGAQAPTPSAIALVLSAGPTTVLVPDVVGRPLEDAKVLLQQVGLTVGEISWGEGGAAVMDASAVVVGQSPAAGSQAIARSRVNLSIGTRIPFP